MRVKPDAGKIVLGVRVRAKVRLRLRVSKGERACGPQWIRNWAGVGGGYVKAAADAAYLGSQLGLEFVRIMMRVRIVSQPQRGKERMKRDLE